MKTRCIRCIRRDLRIVLKNKISFIASRESRQQLDSLAAQLLRNKRTQKSVTEPPSLSSDQQRDYAAAFSKLETALTQPYPFASQCGIGAKYSVSTLTHPDDEFSVPDVSGAFDARPRRFSQRLRLSTVFIDDWPARRPTWSLNMCQ